MSKKTDGHFYVNPVGDNEIASRVEILGISVSVSELHFIVFMPHYPYPEIPSAPNGVELYE